MAVVLLEDGGHARARDGGRGDEPEAEDEKGAESGERQHGDDGHVAVQRRAAVARPRLRRGRDSARRREPLGRCAPLLLRGALLRGGYPGGAALSLETLCPAQSLGALSRLGLLCSTLRGQDLGRSRTGGRRVVDRRRRWRRRRLVVRRRRRRRRPHRWRRRCALDRRRIGLRPGGERRPARSSEPDQNGSQGKQTRPTPTSRLSPNSHFRTPHLRRTAFALQSGTILARWE